MFITINFSLKLQYNEVKLIILKFYHIMRLKLINLKVYNNALKF